MINDEMIAKLTPATVKRVMMPGSTTLRVMIMPLAVTKTGDDSAGCGLGRTLAAGIIDTESESLLLVSLFICNSIRYNIVYSIA